MGKAKEIVFFDTKISENSRNYTGIISETRIKILKPVGKNYKKQMLWLCECGYCGDTFIELPARVLNGHVKSCGCLKTKNKSKAKKSIEYSFYDWCIDNNRNDWLDLWDYDLNNVSPKDIGYKSSSKRWFKCKTHKEHKSELHHITHMVNRGDSNFKCVQCNSFAQWGIDNIGNDFLEKYWDYEKNTKDPWKINAKHNGKVWIKCQKKEYHGSYEVVCNKFTNGCRCPYCNKNSGKIHKFDSLGFLYPEVLEIWSEKNDKSPYEYAPQTNKKVCFKCRNERHNDYEQAICNAVNRDFRCPECVKELKDSMLQTKVSQYILEKYNYTLLHEGDCTINPVNPKTNKKMPFDNEILELKLIIEVNGNQHYEPSFFIKLTAKRRGVSVSEAFSDRVFKDEYKKQYAIEHGYDFLEIPYLAEKNDEYKDLIDKKIKEIETKLNL